MLVSLAVRASEPAVCLTGTQTMTLTTAWQFMPAVVTVNDALPVGTVVASVVIPEGRVLGWCRVPVQAGLWDGRQLQSWYQAAATNVPGLSVRLVTEPAASLPVWSGGRRGWSTSVNRLGRGGLRIELVKNGVVRPGTLTRVNGTVQYRTYLGSPPRAHLAMVETLRYVGRLVIVVNGSLSVPDARRLS
ncbi:hypothetical protein [Serratia sp. CY76391]|uniref:hypothetical protein n=1 Tax=Serratia sp. CY76391 TaxID=3383681 RepID=UPI003FA03DA4